MDEGGSINNRDFEEVTTLLAQSTPYTSALGDPLNPKPAYSPPSEGRWTGLGVAIRSGVVPFLQSLNPGYLPVDTQQKSVNGPAFTLGSDADGDLFQGVELVARLVSPCAGLPEEISNFLGSAFSAAPVLRLAWDQWTAMSNSASKEEPTDRPGKNGKEKAKVPADGPQQADKTSVAAMGAGQLPKAAVALGAMSCLATTAAQSSIEVADAETLGKIGRDPNYPLNGSYRQSSDIDGSGLSQSIGNRSHPFTGQYDGQCHTIDNLRHCLVHTMKDGGHVDSLRFTGANIRSTETTGVVACEILDNALASNIQVKDAYVATSGEEKFAGIGGGYVRGVVTNMTVVNGTVTTSGARAHAGISAGKLEGNSSSAVGTGALSCKVSVSGKGTDAGIGAGHVINGTVDHTVAAHSRVEVLKEGAAGIGAGYVEGGGVVKTTGAYCHVKIAGGSVDATGTAAIGAGTVRSAEVLDTIAVHCSVEGVNANGTAIGAGRVEPGTVARVAAVSSKVKSDASAGIGAGYIGDSSSSITPESDDSPDIGAEEIDRSSTLSNTTSVNSTVEAQDSAKFIKAGIGAGELEGGTISNTTGVDSKILTLRARTKAGIGLGKPGGSKRGYIENTTSVNCELITSGSGSSVGIGVGYVEARGTVVITTALSSRIWANHSSIGVGAGKNFRGTVNHVRAIDCTMNDPSINSVQWVSCIDRCNVRINNKTVPNTPFGCDNSLDDLCKYAAPGLVTKDCKPNNRLLMDIQQALRNINHSHPLPPDFLNPQQVRQFGVCWTRPLNVSAPPLLPAVPSYPSMTIAPTLAGGLSGGAVAGIVLGAVAACALVAGGAYVAHCYSRPGDSEGKYTVN